MLHPVQTVSKGYIKGFVQCVCDIPALVAFPAETIVQENIDLVDYRNEYVVGYQDAFCQFIQQVRTEDLELFGKFILYVLWDWACIDQPLDQIAPLFTEIKDEL